VKLQPHGATFVCGEAKLASLLRADTAARRRRKRGCGGCAEEGKSQVFTLSDEQAGGDTPCPASEEEAKNCFSRR